MADIPLEFYRKKKTLHGFIAHVPDGDGIRFYHQPGLYAWSIKEKAGASTSRNNTINVRLAGVDAPEMPHFGQPGQPFAQEALQHLTRWTRKPCRITLFRVDQYGRVVAGVQARRYSFIPGWIPWVWTDLSLELLQKGLAVVYRGQGADYGSKKAEYERAERIAQLARIGIWSQENHVLPADFKRLTKDNGGANGTKEPIQKERQRNRACAIQ